MKCAIIISGYLRSFKTNLNTIKEKIIDKFNESHVYLHITENEDIDDKYLNDNDEDFINEIKKKINPKVILFERNIPHYTDENKNVVYNQWLKQYKLNSLKKINESIEGDYDLVIKIRPDLYLNSSVDFSYNKNKIFVPIDSKIDKGKLRNPDDNFICDVMAYGDSKSMDLYFDIFKNIDSLFESHGSVPETILYEYINNKIEIEKIELDYFLVLSTCNVFAICGDSGSGKSTLGGLLKKYFKSSFLLECDRYHKWERHDSNWSDFTHLNPESNFLTKMSQDIFDLKIGKTIHQVDYDHKTGKFTQKEKIENSENLIVCGLHSLYNNNNLYNLKIYMDTDAKLKEKWKIERDVTRRGYSIDKVLKQIESRKKDYESFIEPQKKDSNVIINFYINDEHDNNIKLKIMISLDLNYRSLINTFSKMEYKPIIEYGESFVTINFGEYRDSQIFNDLKFKNNDFYDHIIFTLLNINSHGA